MKKYLIRLFISILLFIGNGLATIFVIITFLAPLASAFQQFLPMSIRRPLLEYILAQTIVLFLSGSIYYLVKTIQSKPHRQISAKDIQFNSIRDFILYLILSLIFVILFTPIYLMIYTIAQKLSNRADNFVLMVWIMLLPLILANKLYKYFFNKKAIPKRTKDS